MFIKYGYLLEKIYNFVYDKTREEIQTFIHYIVTWKNLIYFNRLNHHVNDITQVLIK